MKYFLDTEFLEGTQKKWFGQTKPTIDLISIGIVCEDGREYYAISKDFNLKEAWNRYDIKKEWYSIDESNQSTRDVKVYWLRDNVLLPIHYELAKRGLDFDYTFTEWKDIITAREHGIYADRHYKTLKKLIKEYGKSNQQIAEEVYNFCSNDYHKGNNLDYDQRIQYSLYDKFKPQFYGYYSDYDWVVFCWLFGKMIDLPKGFPMYCIDLQQESDRIYNLKKEEYIKKGGKNFINKISNHLDYPKQTNEHNALSDAKWNFKLYKFLNTL